MINKYGLALVASALLSTAGAGVVTTYSEWFDHYANWVEGFNPGTGFEERSSCGMKFLTFAPKEAGLARQGMFAIPTSPKAADWTFSFRYEFGYRETAGQFYMRLFFGDREKPETVDVPVADNEKFLKPEFLAVKGGRAEQYHYSNGVQRVVGTYRLPDKPLVGWNVGGGTGLVVSVTAVRVIDGTACRYEPGDLAEWLEREPSKTGAAIPPGYGTILPDDPKVVRELDLAHNVAQILFKPSTNGVSSISFRLADGRRKEFQFKFRDKSCEYLWMSGCTSFFPWLHGRPRVGNRFREHEAKMIKSRFDRLPRADERTWEIELRRWQFGGYGLYVEGNYVSSVTDGVVTGVSVSPARGAAFAVRERPAKKPTNMNEKLDFRQWPQGYGLWRVREELAAWGLGAFSYPARSCFDALPSSCLFSVPPRQYVQAKARCRVATDVPDDFAPVIVARLAPWCKHTNNYGRSQPRAERQAVLPKPGEKPVPQPGVSFKDLGAGVWEVTFDLDIGEMQDMVFMNDPLNGDQPNPQLDFEFTGVLWQGDTCYNDRGYLPDREKRSSVVVLGGELIASPVSFQARAKHPFSTYYDYETPASDVIVDAPGGDASSVVVTVSDLSGRVLQRETVSGTGSYRRTIAFKPRSPGWYGLEYRCGRIVHRASYCVVPDDRLRESELDSPYYSWVWFGTHGTCRDVEASYDLMQRMGSRGTLLCKKWAKVRTEDDPLVRKYRLKLAQFPFHEIGEVTVRKDETPEAAVARQTEIDRQHVKDYPHTKRALILHENGGGPFPLELIGGKTEISDEQRKNDAIRAEMVTRAAKAWRAADPSVKFVLGNSGDSLGIMASVYRGKVDPQYVDFAGEESVGFSIPPERSTALLAWEHLKLARVMGYPNVGVDCPFEWKCRPARVYQFPEVQTAEYHIRDSIIAHVLGYTLIPVGACPAVGSGYSQSIWGGGSHARWPLGYPSRGAAATATMTAVLDRTKFLRLLPTGSLTVYAPVFSVKGGKQHVAALWTARGETRMKLDLGENKAWELVETYGARTPGDAKAEVAVSEAPVYVVTEKPIAGATLCAPRTFPREALPKGSRTVVAVPLESADEVKLALEFDRRLQAGALRRGGMFEVASAHDALKGSCVAVRDVTGETPEIVMNCAFLKFPKAQPVAGTFDSIGVWVDGNSSWSELFFEVTDAEGEIWLSNGSSGYGGDQYDLPCRAAVSFDGWHFVTFPLTRESPIKIGAPGEDEWQWTRDGKHGNGKIDFPVRVTGLGVGSYLHALDLREMKPVDGRLRFRDVTLIKSGK